MRKPTGVHREGFGDAYALGVFRYGWVQYEAWCFKVHKVGSTRLFFLSRALIYFPFHS